jgi:hypothetical protein
MARCRLQDDSSDRCLRRRSRSTTATLASKTRRTEMTRIGRCDLAGTALATPGNVSVAVADRKVPPLVRRMTAFQGPFGNPLSSTTVASAVTLK